MRTALFPALLCLALASFTLAQDTPSEVRVSVVLNPDGSRTSYETDSAARKSLATTKTADGKLRETINYQLDENGRFSRGEVRGAKGELRFFAQYKYDGSNHVVEEVHLDKDENVIGKIVFHYDSAGHQTGYTTYDGNGRVIGQTAPATSAAPTRK